MSHTKHRIDLFWNKVNVPASRIRHYLDLPILYAKDGYSIPTLPTPLYNYFLFTKFTKLFKIMAFDKNILKREKI